MLWDEFLGAVAGGGAHITFGSTGAPHLTVAPGTQGPQTAAPVPVAVKSGDAIAPANDTETGSPLPLKPSALFLRDARDGKMTFPGVSASS